MDLEVALAAMAAMAAMAATVAMEATEVDGAADAGVVVRVVDGADETTFDDEPNLEND